VKDRIIEANLVVALRAACGRDGNVEARMEDGVAVLRGSVDDLRTRQLAEDVARAVYGVMCVRNELSVNPDWGDEHAPPSTEFQRRRDASAATSARFKLADSF